MKKIFKKKDAAEEMAKQIKVNDSTQSIALDFARRACEAVNKQLGIEIERNGFTLEDLQSGKLKLVREIKTADSNPLFKGESFIIEGKGFRRIIMCVKWTPTGFGIECHTDAVANAVKVNPSFKIQKDTPALVTGKMTQDEIDIEARAEVYMQADREKMAKMTIK